ncbi:DUF3179 domain-containing protein [Leptobacterium flavescens]|uniref:DUF3179 domain-containing protein n=1 Tax=Leptobacterium flavescens TaxID=472055 RepID=A0A6P0ULR3_9FLAO|nr:DUF3179 domain-containing protein [Leptobacterium flavescens]NER13937.1 DUF3179 domain-containing protein [Leptobacterium flavescens]
MWLKIRKISFLFLLFGFLFADEAISQDKRLALSTNKSEITYFLDLINARDQVVIGRSLSYIEKNWKPEYEIMLLELMYFNYNNTDLSLKLTLLLQKKTGKQFGYDHNKWYEWIWSKDEKLHPEYHFFKAKLHNYIDNRFGKYFQDRQDERIIRFDEIRWGGVRQDGIPPLRNPKMIEASQAKYLEDDHVVFGIEVNGDVRAYPKRILAWHEMFTDEVGGIPVAGVYCTLCGTVILYKTEHKGVKHRFGTSGFLYRSNKLMYDKATQSLWNTLWGKPVVGPLVGKGIELEYMSVVTTTWGEWKKRHPNTKVLSLNTGHRRDYGEGVAYQDYFATDELMFNVPSPDKKLKNKQSILAIRLAEYPEDALAVSTKFLKKNPVYQHTIGKMNFVVLTDKTGANRVYETKGAVFSDYDGDFTATDHLGRSWTLSEDKLESTTGEILQRIPAYNAFWFGWKAAYPHTELVK